MLHRRVASVAVCCTSCTSRYAASVHAVVLSSLAYTMPGSTGSTCSIATSSSMANVAGSPVPSVIGRIGVLFVTC